MLLMEFLTGETNCPSADLVEAFIKIIEEMADMVDKVDHLEIWMPSTASEQSVNYLAQMVQDGQFLFFRNVGNTSLIDNFSALGLHTEGLMARHMLDRLRVIKGLHYFEELYGSSGPVNWKSRKNCYGYNCDTNREEKITHVIISRDKKDDTCQ
ncbi:hypothetical protein C5167_002652 [Papaver somniferum]|uniref:Uncharacterized protein n=1 Tax=Papaver somniferum TaxID=3469 RepID=A0A4Y7L1E1_PAPSO|nr:hypothetical protein C5167_002652 [Papaver somniferum]